MTEKTESKAAALGRKISGVGTGKAPAETAIEAPRKKKGKYVTVSFVLANLMFIATIAAILIPGKTVVRTSVPFIVACCIIEALFIWRYSVNGHKRSSCHILVMVWILFIIWEVMATDLKMVHPVLFPIPENVFNVFPRLQGELTRNVQSSMMLLLQGFLTSLIAANIIGLFVGWLPRVRETIYPIAHVLAPVPAIVFTPYLVMILPSFKWAAVAVIFLGIFWPTLLNTILRVENMDRHIIQSARMMGLSTPTMIFRVLLPYMYPAIVTGLKVQLPTAMLMLVMAEMYGATSGLGYFIINYTNYAEYTNVVAGIIMVGVVVTILDAAVGLLIRKTVKWTE